MSEHDGIRFFDGVRLSAAERRLLLESLDADATKQHEAMGGENRREDERSPFHEEVQVTIEHPGGGVSHVVALARNVSSQGLSFLHGGFVHTGTRCQIHLSTVDGERVTLTAATVRSCRHVRGRIHELGVRFDERISIDTLRGVESPATAGSASAGTVTGRLLYLVDSPLDYGLFARHLADSGVETESAADQATLLDRVASGDVDFVFVNMHLDDGDAAEAIEALRDTGFTGPITGVCAEAREAGRASAAGATHTLALPVCPAELLDLLAVQQLFAGAADDASPLYSTIEDPAMTSLVHAFVDEAIRAGRRLAQATSADDADAVRTICQGLRGTAPACGFPIVGDLASAAVHRLDEGAGIEGVTWELGRLQSVCGRLGKRAAAA